jgi:hypothetical protein
MRIIGLLTIVCLLQGCSIQQKVTPVGNMEIAEINIIENPAVKTAFRDAVKTAVEKQGVTAELPPASSIPEDYPYALTYTANWTWDLALYLVYAEINVFSQGNVIGTAVYDSTRGGMRMDKFISAEKKVDELVTQLFAREASSDK